MKMLARPAQALTALAVLLLLACAPSLPLLRADQPVATAAAPQPLLELADDGQFTRVLDLLRQSQNADPRVLALVQDLQQHSKFKEARDARRLEAKNKALAELDKHLAAGRIQDAVISAIEAHSLADDQAALLASDTVKTVAELATAKARAAEERGDWLEALNVYRSLDLLYDDMSSFREPVRRAERHVRVIRLYNPREMERMFNEHARKRAAERAAAGEDEKKDKPEDATEDGEDLNQPLVLGEDTWEQTLDGVRFAMLRPAMVHAARRHVGAGGYYALLSGAVDSLDVLVQTQAIGPVFPKLQDAASVDRFRQGLADLRKELDSRKDRLNFLDADRLIDSVWSLNLKTVSLPEAVVVHEMADGALGSLDDFTGMIWPREKDQFSRNTQGKFYGIGVQIAKRDGRLVVVSPLADTPAQRAGLKAGDFLVKVDGRDTAAWSIDQAVREITGPEGTEVVLGVERVGEKDLLTFRLKRAEIIIESIRGWSHKPDGTWDYYIDRDNRIGYIRMSQFIPQTADDLDAAINAMEKDAGLGGLILDLRFNPGGLLSSAIEVSDRFVNEGPIVSTVDSSGIRTSEARARRDRTYRPFPVVVLINEGSASASEIVSGALQDYGRALIVGTNSFGKGSVQDLFPIDGGKAYLKLTTQYYKLPKGRIIHRKPDGRDWGIHPDLEVKMTTQQVADSIKFRQEVDVLRGQGDEPAEDGKPMPLPADILAKDMDPQLEAAVLVLKTRLVAQHIALAQNTVKAATTQ